MASDEILRDIKQHMARGNELMGEIRQEHALNREAYSQGMELCAHLIQRVDGIFERHAKALDRLSAKVEAGTEQIRENTKTTRLMRESLVRFLDRLDDSGDSAPA